MDSRGYAGTINTQQYAELSQRFGGACTILGPSTWEVVPDSSVDRGVLIKQGTDGGQGYGYGVLDTSTADVRKAGDAVAAGTSRWDTVVVRRDWRPRDAADTSDRTTFELVPGGPQKAIAAGVLGPAGKGVLADQPLALVRFTSESTIAHEVVDLRLWRGEGGAAARSPLVRSFYDDIGTHLTIAEPGQLLTEHRAVPAVDGSGRVVRGWHTTPIGALHLYAQPSLRNEALDGQRVPPDAAILEQADHTLITTNRAGDFTVIFPRPFPSGLHTVQATITAGIGGVHPAPVSLVLWGGTSAIKPDRRVFHGRVHYVPDGMPYTGGTFGINWRATGW